ASRSPNGRGHVGSHGPCGRGKLAHPSPEGQATIYPRFEHRELPLEEIREQLPRRRDLDARGAAPPEHGETQGARADEEDFVVDAEHDGETGEPSSDVAIRRLRLAGEQRVRASELVEQARTRHAGTRKWRDSRNRSGRP